MCTLVLLGLTVLINLISSCQAQDWSGTYRFQSIGGLNYVYLSNTNVVSLPGTQLLGWHSLSPGDPNYDQERWELVLAEPPSLVYYYIVSVANPQIVAELGNDGSSADGQSIYGVQQSTDRLQQQWSVQYITDPIGSESLHGFRFINRVGNTALHLYGNNPNDGALIAGWDQTWHQNNLEWALDPPPPSTVSGDPQFFGLQGQIFQVHGYPNEIFSLISTPDFCLNSQFVYISNGVCNYNNTACWTHPGTYLNELGFLINNNKIKVSAGAHSVGMHVMVNEKTVTPSSTAIQFTATDNNNDNAYFVLHINHDTLIVRTPLFEVEITNSDHFFNLRVALLDNNLLDLGSSVTVITEDEEQNVKLVSRYSSVPLHGLVGQTWKNIQYPRGRMYEGTIEEYMIVSRDIFDPIFPFSRFNSHPSATAA